MIDRYSNQDAAYKRYFDLKKDPESDPNYIYNFAEWHGFREVEKADDSLDAIKAILQFLNKTEQELS